MFPRPIIFFIRLLSWACVCGFVSCTKKEQSFPDGGNNILSFSLYPGKDITSINTSAHRISVLVSDTVSRGRELPAYFALSPGAFISVDGVNQESGMTLNNFEKDLPYT